MRFRALLLLGLAIVLGAVAAYMVNDIVTREISGETELLPRVVQPAVVAAIDIPTGTTIEAAAVRLVDLPAEAYPAGSYPSIEQLFAAGSTVAIQDLVAGEVILPGRISSGIIRSGLTARIPDGQRAISVAVDEIRGVAGFVLPGDKVDVLHTTSIGRRDERPVTRTLMQGLTVLGVDQISDDGQDDPVVVNVVTLLVTPEQAKALTLAEQVGNLTLALRNEGDDAADESSTVALTDLWSITPEDVAAGSGTASAGSQASRRSIQIIRGLQVEQETVEAQAAAPAAPNN